MAKSAKKMETVRFISPFGTARFPKLSKPDTEGKYADGKFKVQLILDDADVEAFRKLATDAAKKLLPGVALEDMKLPLKEFYDKINDEKTPAGWGFEAKSKNRPLVMDARRNKLPESAIIGSGSVIRVSGAFAAYERAEEMVVVENGVKARQKVVTKGLNIYLNGVQVKELSSGNGASDGSEFEAVEGFEYEAQADDTFSDATDL